MRLAVLVLVLVNALVLTFGLRGGFARLDVRWSGAGPEIAPLPAPAQTGSGPRLALLHERATSPDLRSSQTRSPPMPNSAPPVEPATAAHAAVPVANDPAPSDPPGASETPAEPAHNPPAGIVPADKAAPTPGDACLIAGPFDAQQDAARTRFEAAANDAGARLLGRETRTSGPVRQWVVLEGFASASAARAALERLRAAGFADLAPVQLPDGWVVSLGMFGQAPRARQHRDAVRAAGFDAVLRERASGATRQWLRFAAPAGVDVGALRGVLAGAAALTACPPGER